LPVPAKPRFGISLYWPTTDVQGIGARLVTYALTKYSLDELSAETDRNGWASTRRWGSRLPLTLHMPQVARDLGAEAVIIDEMSEFIVISCDVTVEYIPSGATAFGSS
jgi:hypothetical protein